MEQQDTNPRRACVAHAKGTILNPVAFHEIAPATQSEVWIELDGKLYRLQLTKQGKLILTK